jgi:hypothetical protein
MARLYESSTDYEENITYAGETLASDRYDSEADYDRITVTYEGAVTAGAFNGYANTTNTYRSTLGYNGGALFQRTATSSGVGGSSATQVISRVRAATGFGTGTSAALWLNTIPRSATGSGTGTAGGGATGFATSFRAGTGSGTGASSSVYLHTNNRTATGSGAGTHSIVSAKTIQQQLIDYGRGRSVTVKLTSRQRTSSAAGLSSTIAVRRIRKMARYTVNNVIERVRRQLNSSLRHEFNVLSVSASQTDTTLTLQYDLTPAVRAGAIISIGYELMRVTNVDSSLKQITVIRGWHDSNPELHAAGDELLINPRFTRFDIFDALIDELASWETELYRVVSYQWNVDEDQDTIEVPLEYEDAVGLVQVYRQWTTSDSTAWPSIKFRLQRGVVGGWDAVSASGMLIRLVTKDNHVPAGKIHALIAMPFDIAEPLSESSNLVSILGLTPSQVDLLVQGIKLRLLTDDENIRGSRLGADSSRMDAVNPINATTEMVQTARANYIRRYQEEITKLRARYPMKAW